MSTSLIDATG